MYNNCKALRGGFVSYNQLGYTNIAGPNRQRGCCQNTTYKKHMTSDTGTRNYNDGSSGNSNNYHEMQCLPKHKGKNFGDSGDSFPSGSSGDIATTTTNVASDNKSYTLHRSNNASEQDDFRNNKTKLFSSDKNAATNYSNNDNNHTTKEDVSGILLATRMMMS